MKANSYKSNLISGNVPVKIYKGQILQTKHKIIKSIFLFIFILLINNLQLPGKV